MYGLGDEITGLREEAEDLKQQIRYLEGRIAVHEDAIVNLTEELVGVRALACAIRNHTEKQGAYSALNDIIGGIHKKLWEQDLLRLHPETAEFHDKVKMLELRFNLDRDYVLGNSNTHP
jgi:hypothetical protein